MLSEGWLDTLIMSTFRTRHGKRALPVLLAMILTWIQGVTGQDGEIIDLQNGYYLLKASPDEIAESDPLAFPDQKGLPPAGVSGLTTNQIRYADPPFADTIAFGNMVRITWIEGSFIETVALLIDGIQVIELPGRRSNFPVDNNAAFVELAPSCLPGDPGYNLSPVPERCDRDGVFDGREMSFRTFEVIGDDGSSDMTCQQILQTWPFSNNAEFC